MLSTVPALGEDKWDICPGPALVKGPRDLYY
jgi:hypothetical protein